MRDILFPLAMLLGVGAIGVAAWLQSRRAAVSPPLKQLTAASALPAWFRRRKSVPNHRKLHEQSLKANRPDLYRHLKASGQLEQHLDEVAQSAQTLRQRVRYPLKRSQFRQILQAVPVNSSGGFGVPWGTPRDRVPACLPSEIAAAVNDAVNRSETLLGCETTIADHAVRAGRRVGD